MLNPKRAVVARVIMIFSSLYQCSEILTICIKTAGFFFCFDNFHNSMKEVHEAFIGYVNSVSLIVSDVHSADLQFI